MLALGALAVSAVLLQAEPEPKTATDKATALTSARIIERADLFFEAGTRQWNERNFKLAQTQFDQAISSLMSAPASLPGRASVEARYRRMVEDIYRLEVDTSSPEAEPAFEESPLDEIIDLTFPTDPKLKARVLEQVRATASQLPLELADPVVQFINYFQSPRGKSTLRFGLQRMGRYEPMIRRILDEEGVPQELIHLAQAESAFQPRAMSWAKAGGMWQFVPATGKEYGLKAGQLHDDRFDPEQATRAAARYLRDLYEEFGDWYLAVASYNCGAHAVARAVERTGHADFWELYRRNQLPHETANYVPIILAMTIMAKNPTAYGLDDLKPAAPFAYESVELSAPTHLALVADLTGTSLDEIRELNPAIHRMVAPNGYRLHIPKDAPATMMAALESIPADRRASWRLHRVGSQETLEAIAKQYKTTEAKIAEVNNEAVVDEMEAGDFMIIPVAYPGSQEAEPVRAKARVAVRPAIRATKTVAARKARSKKTVTPAKQAIRPNPVRKTRAVASVNRRSRRDS
jgi:membrane-bound lytic murein transglycosylase D